MQEEKEENIIRVGVCVCMMKQVFIKNCSRVGNLLNTHHNAVSHTAHAYSTACIHRLLIQELLVSIKQYTCTPIWIKYRCSAQIHRALSCAGSFVCLRAFVCGFSLSGIADVQSVSVLHESVAINDWRTKLLVLLRFFLFVVRWMHLYSCSSQHFIIGYG